MMTRLLVWCDCSRCTEMSGRHERSLHTLRCGGGCQHGRFCSRALPEAGLAGAPPGVQEGALRVKRHVRQTLRGVGGMTVHLFGCTFAVGLLGLHPHHVKTSTSSVIG